MLEVSGASQGTPSSAEASQRLDSQLCGDVPYISVLIGAPLPSRASLHYGPRHRR
jgi:hypothetical protein